MDPREIRSAIADAFEQRYVDAEIGARVAGSLTLDDVPADAEPSELAASLTARLRELSGDGHVSVDVASPAEGDGAWIEDWKRSAPLRNFGIRRVAYPRQGSAVLELSTFHHTELSGPALRAAFTLLSVARGLVIDVRGNGGGHPSGVEAVRGFLGMGPSPIQMLDRDGRDHTADWRSDFGAFDPGARLPEEAPVAVLTSTRTFSAAEHLAYEICAEGRGRIFGMATAGGANAPDRVELGAGLDLWVPTIAPIHPSTGANWEGDGVQPDVRCEPEEAEHLALDWLDDARRDEC